MKNKISHLPPALHELAANHFRLLESKNIIKKRDSIQLNLSGYSDVMFLIADIVKVSILALGDGENHSLSRINNPASNVSGVLGIILDLIPYEEADLLDHLREAVLQPEQEISNEEDFILENIFLTVPDCFRKPIH
ncbi:hypothetical protein [Flavobacterium sp.]